MEMPPMAPKPAFCLLFAFGSTVLCSTFAGFEPGSSNQLDVLFGGTALNYSGQRLTTTLVDTESLPTLGLPSAATDACNETYLALMIDPDAVSGNIETQAALHTLQGNFTCSTANVMAVGNISFHEITSSSAALAPFVAPDPQSGTHRYTLMLFQQPLGYLVPEAYKYAMPLNLSNITNRLYFNVEDFTKNLTIVAGNYYDVAASKPNGTTSSASGSISTQTGSTASSTSDSTTANMTSTLTLKVEAAVFSLAIAFIITLL